MAKTPRPPIFHNWETLNSKQQKLFIDETLDKFSQLKGHFIHKQEAEEIAKWAYEIDHYTKDYEQEQ